MRYRASWVIRKPESSLRTIVLIRFIGNLCIFASFTSFSPTPSSSSSTTSFTSSSRRFCLPFLDAVLSAFLVVLALLLRSCSSSMLEDGIDTTSLTVPLQVLLFFSLSFFVVLVLFFLLGVFVGLVSFLFFSAVGFLEEAIVFGFRLLPTHLLSDLGEFSEAIKKKKGWFPGLF